jgi:prepilin signal peptidase PulO-like enzyme (type II secretory pathway)
MLKAINFKRLFLLIVIFIVLAMITGFITVADEETGLGSNGAIVTSLIAVAEWTFKISMFPLMFITSVGFFNYFTFFGILIFDSVLYSLAIEMALVWYKRYKLKENADVSLFRGDSSRGVPK